jgi:predicted metal-dependent peptidase
MDEDFSKALEFLRKARLKLTGAKYRFFGLCLYSVRTVLFGNEPNLEGYVAYEQNDITKQFENKIHINGDIIRDRANYKTKNMLDIMLHEFNHILRRHDIRRGDRDGEMWNIACDHVIDKSLKKLNLSEPIFKWHIIREIENDANYTSEESVYNWIIQNQNQQHKIQINKKDDGGINVKEEWYGTDFTLYPDLQSAKNKADITPEQVQAIENYVSQIRVIYEIEKERGNISGEVKEAFEKLLEVHVPWETVLEKALKKNAFEKVDRRNWKRPNKFFINSGIYLPGRVPYRENNGIGTLIIHIDSSGSISSKELRKAGFVIYKSIQYFEKIIVLVADVEIHQTAEFRRNNQEEMLKYFQQEGFKGRGGTSHTFVFKYFDKYLEDNPDDLSICISITDMYSNIDSALSNSVFHKQVPLILLSTSTKKINQENVTTICIS